MRRINLLPPEIVARRRARQMTFMMAAGVGGVAVVLILVYLLQAGRLSGARGRLDSQQRENRGLEGQVQELSRFSELQAELENKRTLLVRLTENEVRWSVILNDVATFIPSDVWLTGFTGSVTPPSGVTTGVSGRAVAVTVGQIQASGCTLRPVDGTHLEVAKFLVRIGIPKEFFRPYLSLTTKGAGNCPVSFNSSIGLSEQALRKNQRGGERTP